MTQPNSIYNATNIPADIQAHIISNTRTDVQKQHVWILCESQYDMKLYRRFFVGRVSVYPAKLVDENGKTRSDCDSVSQIVSTILNGKHTQHILGIRDRDYIDFLPKRDKPILTDHVFMTDVRDIEMMLYSSNDVKTSLYGLHPNMERKISDCEQLLRYLGYLRIWHARNNQQKSIKKFTAKLLCTNNSPKQIKSNWKNELVNKYNDMVGTQGLMSVSYLNRYGRFHCLSSRKFTEICRGHDFTDLVGKYIDDGRINKNIISSTLASAYTLSDFLSTQLSQKIQTLVSEWGITIELNSLYV